MPQALIALGSNLGDRRQTLDRAVAALAALPGVRVVGRSTWCETPSIGGPSGQPAFLNGAATLDCSLSPAALLAALHEVEASLGRRRDEHWAARTLDLDLLLYDDLIVESPALTVPHPRMAFRRFVLAPALEVAADWTHPQIGWTLAQLWQHLEVSANYVAVAGPPGVGKSELAQAVAAHLAGDFLAAPVEAAWLAAFSVDPAGLGWQTAIEFLDRWADLLDVQHDWHSRRLAISDFWFDELLAWASVWFLHDGNMAFERYYQGTRNHVIVPRLTVWLDDEPPALLQRVAERGRAGEQAIGMSSLAALREAIARQVRLPGRGPVLKLSAADRLRAVEEVVAAIQSMQVQTSTAREHG